MALIKKKNKKIRTKETINPALHIMKCPKCGQTAASANEKIWLPDWTTCKNLNCKY